MKAIISSALIFLSVLLAYMRSLDLRERLNGSEDLFDLANDVKSNFNGGMRPLHVISSEFFTVKNGKNINFNSPDELISYLNEKYGDLPFISEFARILALIPISVGGELMENCEKLRALAENGVNESKTRYKKDSSRGYILFPGLISIFILILI